MIDCTSLAPLLESFFTERLMQQRQASPHTIRSYRDTFRQLLKFAQKRQHKAPSRLTFEEIDAPLILAFLMGPPVHSGAADSPAAMRQSA
jgi:site-specific recombinase XerC